MERKDDTNFYEPQDMIAGINSVRNKRTKQNLRSRQTTYGTIVETARHPAHLAGMAGSYPPLSLLGVAKQGSQF